MIYLLLAVTMALFLIAFYSSGEDILSPGVIVCLMWTFSTICAIYNIDNWGVNIHFSTICVIALGLISVLFGVFIGRYSRKIRWCSKSKKLSEVYEISEIHVNYTVAYLILAIDFLTVIWQFRWLMASGGGGDWLSMMAQYRQTSASWDTDSVLKPSLLANLEIMLSVSAYVFPYVGINNIVSGSKDKRNIILIFPAVLFAIDKLLNAGRGDILILIGAIIFAVYICVQRRSGWKRKVSRRFIKYLVVALVLVVVFFSYTRIIVGRTNQSGILEYVTTYAGGSVQLFDLFLHDPPEASSIWGKETFGKLINLLGSRFGIDDWVYVRHSEFRLSNGVNIGNVYGAFRKYMYDFGYPGVVVLSMLVGIFYSYLYKRIQKDGIQSNDGFDWKVIFYMYMAPSLFMFSISDYTYALLGDIIMLLKWYCIAWIIKRLLVNGFLGLRIGSKII